MVSVAVEIERGECRWFQGPETLAFACRQNRPCRTTITRKWSDLPPETTVEHGILVEGEWMVLRPPPDSGSGTDQTTREGPELRCDDDPGQGVIFRVESDACGLSAQVRASCSRYLGDM